MTQPLHDWRTPPWEILDPPLTSTHGPNSRWVSLAPNWINIQNKWMESFKKKYWVWLMIYQLLWWIHSIIPYVSNLFPDNYSLARGCVPYFRSYFRSSFYLPVCTFYLVFFCRITQELCYKHDDNRTFFIITVIGLAHLISPFRRPCNLWHLAEKRLAGMNIRKIVTFINTNITLQWF